MSRARTAVLLGVAALLLGACSTAARSSPPTWEPSPTFGPNGEGPGVQISPIIPVPSQSTRPGGQPGSTSPSPGSSSSGPATDSAVVATNLTTPVGVTIMPDNTALVGERTTGRIVRVQPVPDRPVPVVKTLTGLDTSGDGGLLDLAVSPTYDEDNLIYAYITTKTDNRVVDFTLNGPVTPVVTGIPKGRTDNTGRIAFGGDGDLYIGTGDAGDPKLAADPHSLAGKVLRVTDIGRPAPGNPVAGSAVFTSGQHVVNGLCALTQTTSMFEVETAGSASRPDDVNLLQAGGYYGWPTQTATAERPLATMPAADRGPGGCAVQDGTLYVTSLDGKALLSARTTGTATGLRLGSFGSLLVNKYGRLKTVVAAADGALWLTTSNKDGHGTPVPTDERVIRYIPPSGGGGQNPA